MPSITVRPLALALLLALAPGIAASASAASAVPRDRIDFPDRAPAGLVGDGHVVMRVSPAGYAAHSGARDSARFALEVDGVRYPLADGISTASFVPGGVVYTTRQANVTLEVMHGTAPGLPYFAAVRVRAARGVPGPVALVLDTRGRDPHPGGARLPLWPLRGAGIVTLALGAPPPVGTWDELLARVTTPYREGLVLRTPSPALDRAVPFCRALLDVGFDGRMHVCEMDRWRDVWSRDLGSGLVPGAMASGRFAAAYTTLDYDLRRHAAADPRGLKVTEDPSQGGSAEGVSWVLRAVERRWLLDGDRDTLRAAVATLRPWVDAWLERDADERGLLVDVTEWMDHSRFFLFPDGARVLYSNVLFAEGLHRVAELEDVLGDSTDARRHRAAGERFARAIDATLWDERNAMYDNLELWGRRDERSAAAENALAVLCGVASEDRARRALATVRARNWAPAGSTTIFPPMTHVPDYIDHNHRFWPWWNAVEARARMRIGDVDGAVHLLECCAATLEDEHLPGMMEELTSPEGRTEGGFAFLTGAGSYLDAIVSGLLGVEPVAPGCARLRVAPHVPAGWREWSADVPLPRGAVRLRAREGRLSVEVTDPRVREVEVPAGTRITGATAVPLVARPFPSRPPGALASLPPLPPPAPRAAAVLVPPMGPIDVPAGLPARRVAAEALASLDPADVGALIVVGNALPRRTRGGLDVPAALARYLDAGGALVFWGATMMPRGTMGETGGVIEWWEPRPWVRAAPIADWELRLAGEGPGVARADERGAREGWARDTTAGGDWSTVPVPKAWEDAGHPGYDGWGWYRARFTLPATAKGKPVVIEPGRIDDRDWTSVNGIEVGNTSDWQAIRRYRIAPGDPAYAALRFGGENTLAIQVLDTGGGGGLYADVPRAGVETDSIAWTPIDPKSGQPSDRPIRLGVVSWGPGGRFFNSWETARGAFGFQVEGRGLAFAGPFADLRPVEAPVGEAFTDFAVAKPWRFEPLAFTTTDRHILVPDRGERYPCAARLVDSATGGEIVLLPASLTRAVDAGALLGRLRLGGTR